MCRNEPTHHGMQIGSQDQTSQPNHELYLYTPQRLSAFAALLVYTKRVKTLKQQKYVAHGILKEYNMAAKTSSQGKTSLSFKM